MAIRTADPHRQCTALDAALSLQLVSVQVYNYCSIISDPALWPSVGLDLNMQPLRIDHHNWQALPIKHSAHGSLSIWQPVSVSTTDHPTHPTAEWRLFLTSIERLIFWAILGQKLGTQAARCASAVRDDLESSQTKCLVTPIRILWTGEVFAGLFYDSKCTSSGTRGAGTLLHHLVWVAH